MSVVELQQLQTQNVPREQDINCHSKNEAHDVDVWKFELSLLGTHLLRFRSDQSTEVWKSFRSPMKAGVISYMFYASYRIQFTVILADSDS